MRLPVSGTMVCNDGLLRQAARDGLGIVVQPSYVLHDDLQSGRLVKVLEGWHLPRLSMNLAFPSRARMPARTRLFIDALAEYFRRNNFEALW